MTKYHDELHVLELISKEKGLCGSEPYPFTAQEIINCIDNVISESELTFKQVFVALVSRNYEKLPDDSYLENFYNYNLNNVLLSGALFPVFDKYNTVNSAKMEYSGNKGEDNYFNETFSHFGIDATKYNVFLDMCCNPGTFSLFMLKKNPKIRGYGITLQPNKGGYKPHALLEASRNFKIIYRDLLESNMRTFRLNEKVDFAYSGCFINHNVGKTHLARVLYVNSYIVAMNSLKPGGVLLNLMSFRWDYLFLLDTIEFFLAFFNRVRLYKSETFTAGLSNVHIFCEGYFKSESGEENNQRVLLIERYVENKISTHSRQTLKTYASSIDNIFKIMNNKHIQLIEKSHSKQST